MRELDRLLRPNGYLILTAPFCSMTHFSPYFFYTGYSANFYNHWLGALGYSIKEMQWNGNYFQYIAQELRRLPSMCSRYAGASPTFWERYAINMLLAFLGRVAEQNNRSEELMCYGIHVLAMKNSQ
ncbi:MAG: class I SAM-dependent methyltransferase [Caldilineaceae bacterium]|nr:class I SAM-dependent methyltransferase [Caldilineaceae bacterium]